jgi:hypothetical protein
VWPRAAGGEAVLYEDDQVVPVAEWRSTGDGSRLARAGGFRAGSVYRYDYDAVGAVVGGCGLLALRDIVAWLRDSEGSSRTLLFGVSQSGRMIRQFLHDRMNIGEDGAPVYDAVVPVIAGGRRGQFNQRFAVPGSLPTSPDEVDDDPRWGELLKATDPVGASPKVMAINSSSEYWRGDAALVHGDPHPDVRVHHVAGTQHVPGTVPQLFEIPVLGWRGQHGFNTVDWRPVVRSLVAQTVDWVEGAAPAGPSVVPHEQQLGDRASVLATYGRLGKATCRAESFVQPEGPVPAVDEAGNEVGGIRLPDIAEPIGVHTGWNVRHPDSGAPGDEVFLMGSTWWFECLPTLEDHLAATRRVIEELVERRLVLARDADLLLGHAEARWNAARGYRTRRPEADACE